MGVSAWGVVSRVPVNIWRNIILFVLLVWVCHSLASLFWQVIPSPELPKPAVVAAPVKASVGATSTVAIDVDALVDLKLFGDAVEQLVDNSAPSPEVVDDNVDDIEDTDLNIKLHAVVSSSDQSAARAIIANGSAQELYRVDDEIMNGVTLTKVLSDRVIISNRGKQQALWLYTEGESLTQSLLSDGSQRPEPSASTRSREASSGRQVRASPSRDQSSGPTQRSAPSRTTQSRREPQGVKRVVLPRSQVANATSVMDALRFSLHREGGQLIGVRLRPGRDRTLFDQAGLKTEDIVTSVNGVQMNEMSKMRRVMQELKTASSADLEIQRGQEVLNISISVN